VHLGDRGSRWRCLLVWASGTSTLAAAVVLALPRALSWRSAAGPAGQPPLDAALVDVAAGVVVACAGWAWLALTAVVVEAWRGVRRERRAPWQLPDGVRRVVLAGCGLALASTAAVPAHADSGGDAPHLHVARLSGLPLPDRPVAPAWPHRAGHHPDRARTVVVRTGDSLWSIARRELGPAATDREVVARWRAIYAANRGRIGPDPDLITPGQHLRLPRKDRS
jgi:nucleoid-associated protein YgaU